LRQLRVDRLPYGQLQSKGGRFPSRAKYEWLIKFCSAATLEERRELERIQPCTIAALTKKKYSSHGGKLYKIVRPRGKNIDVLNEVIPVDKLFDWLCDNYEGDDEKEFKARADKLQVDMTMEAINAFIRVIQNGNKLLASHYRRRSKVRQPNVEEVEIEEEGVDDGDEEVGDGDEEIDDGDKEAGVPSAGSGDGDNDDTETEESSSDSEPEDDDSDFNDNDANEIQSNTGRGKKGLKAYARRPKPSAESSPKQLQQQQHSQDPKRPREMEVRENV